MNVSQDDSSLRQLMMTSDTTEHDTSECLQLTTQTDLLGKGSRTEDEDEVTTVSTKLLMDSELQDRRISTKEASHAVAVAAVAAVLSHGLVPLAENPEPPTPPPKEETQEEETQPLTGEETYKRVVDSTWKVVSANFNFSPLRYIASFSGSPYRGPAFRLIPYISDLHFHRSCHFHKAGRTARSGFAKTEIPADQGEPGIAVGQIVPTEPSGPTDRRRRS